MNPVRSYHDFQEFMNYWNYNGKPIPVLLIKPNVLLSLRHDYSSIDELFDYFNHRTGEGIVFFLPGYSHYPVTSFAEIFPSPIMRPDKEFAMTYYDYRTQQAHHVYYNNRDFVDFINIIEHGAPEFRYYGDTELLLSGFIPGSANQFGNLDFSTLPDHRYNLSELYRSHGINGHYDIFTVERFLEEVRCQIEEYCSEDEFYKAVDKLYSRLLTGKKERR